MDTSIKMINLNNIKKTQPHRVWRQYYNVLYKLSLVYDGESPYCIPQKFQRVGQCSF